MQLIAEPPSARTPTPWQRAAEAADALDTPCGYCESRGRRDIPGGVWLSGSTCPECAGAGYLVTSADAGQLLAFVERHLGSLLRLELASLRERFIVESGSRGPRVV